MYYGIRALLESFARVTYRDAEQTVFVDVLG